eukprot:jgi/Chlat1/7113/Chrsp57S00532
MDPGTSVPVRPVTYLCGDCGADNQLRPGDVIQCRECGYRILYKKRTKRASEGNSTFILPVCGDIRPDLPMCSVSAHNAFDMGHYSSKAVTFPPCRAQQQDHLVLTDEAAAIADLVLTDDDLLLCILRFLPSLQDLCVVARVSRRWNALSQDSVAWHEHFKRVHPQLGKQLQPRGPVDWKRVCKAVDALWSNKYVESLAIAGIASSSHEYDQTIEHTCRGDSYGFWSSAPCLDKNGSEWLKYQLLDGPAIIKSVSLMPFASRRCYAPRALKVFAGMSSDDQCLYPGSQEYSPVRNRPYMEEHPLPDLVLGEYVKLDMYGYHAAHFVSGREQDYYQCLMRVLVVGHPCDTLKDQYLRQVVASCTCKAS